MWKFIEVRSLIQNLITVLTMYPKKHAFNYSNLNAVNIYNQGNHFDSPCITL